MPYVKYTIIHVLHDLQFPSPKHSRFPIHWGVHKINTNLTKCTVSAARCVKSQIAARLCCTNLRDVFLFSEF